MNTTTALFYVFSAVLLFASLRVITSRSTVHAALFLVLAFFSAACVWMLLRAEFLAIALVLVYVGAVMVLFLFVVMMLDIDFAALKGELARYMPLGLLIGVVLLMQVAIGVGVWKVADGAEGLRQAVAPSEIENTRALGMLLYDKYFLLFQLAGLILLVAMIGAILLTLRHRKDIKRQNVLAQMWRDPAKAMELKDVKPGQGL